MPQEARGRNENSIDQSFAAGKRHSTRERVQARSQHGFNRADVSGRSCPAGSAPRERVYHVAPRHGVEQVRCGHRAPRRRPCGQRRCRMRYSRAASRASPAPRAPGLHPRPRSRPDPSGREQHGRQARRRRRATSSRPQAARGGQARLKACDFEHQPVRIARPARMQPAPSPMASIRRRAACSCGSDAIRTPSRRARPDAGAPRPGRRGGTQRPPRRRSIDQAAARPHATGQLQATETLRRRFARWKTGSSAERILLVDDRFQSDSVGFVQRPDAVVQQPRDAGGAVRSDWSLARSTLPAIGEQARGVSQTPTRVPPAEGELGGEPRRLGQRDYITLLVLSSSEPVAGLQGRRATAPGTGLREGSQGVTSCV